MPVTEITRLKAKASKLNIANYRSMSADELRVAIEQAEYEDGAKPSTKKTTPTKSASAAKKAPGKKTAAKKATKTSPPADESKSQKSAPKGTAAKGEAKREASPKVAPKAKTKPAAEVRVHQTQPGRVGAGGYTNLDRGAIDWTVETTVAQTGKRKDVLDALRKHKGDYALAFETLREHALGWFPTALNTYPKSSTKKNAAERMLRWLVARVAYDFAYKTGQHVGRAAKKKAPAKSTKKPAAPKKTAAAKTPRKPAGAAQKAAKPKTAAKPRTAATKAQKPAGAKLPATAKARQSARKRGAR